MSSIGRIQKLDESVINKIAAGEIIHRPHNALKELIENSIDAKANIIQITVKDGGMKMLQIHDNGVGIDKIDLDIVCERFTTSKITSYENLSSIETYGFRGEALASISQVSHLTITTKTNNSTCAYKCIYLDGKLKSTPHPCAGNQGTQITIEDLFYNLSTRRKALSNPSQEYSKLCDITMKYAIHNSHVSFALKKVGSQIADIKTNGNGNIQQIIQSLYGVALCKNLVELTHVEPNLKFSFHCLFTDPNGRTRAECKPATSPFLLFVNHRLVDWQPLKKMLDSIYSETISDNVKGGRATNYFAYVDLKVFSLYDTIKYRENRGNQSPFPSKVNQFNGYIWTTLAGDEPIIKGPLPNSDVDPQNLDVNIHPTKKEVCFLYEDEIILALRQAVEEKVLHYDSGLPNPFATNTVRSVSGSTQTSKVGPTPMPDEDSLMGEPEATAPFLDCTEEEQAGSCSRRRSQKRTVPPIDHILPQYMNRSDFKSQKLDRYLSPKSNATRANEGLEESTGDKQTTRDTNGTEEAYDLASVQALKKGIFDEADWSLTKLIREHVFVGPVDFRHVLVQHDTSLYMADTQQLARELYYQVVVKKFGKLGRLKIVYVDAGEETPSNGIGFGYGKSSTNDNTLYKLALRGLERPGSGWDPKHGSREECAGFVRSLLCSKAEMLDDYFSLRLSPTCPSGGDYYVATLPLLIPGEYEIIPHGDASNEPPNLSSSRGCAKGFFGHLVENLDDYVLRLATEVEWENEGECFRTFAQQTANFLASKWANQGGEKSTEPAEGVKSSEETLCRGDEQDCIEECRNVLEKILYPAFKKYLVVPNRLSTTDALVKVADLKDLYKIFERC